MKLSKNQMILAGTGAAAGLAVLALCWLTFGAYSKKSQLAEDSESNLDNINSIRDAKIYPSKASIAAVVSNRNEIAEWIENAKVYASRGDRKFTPARPAQFKQLLQETVRRLGRHTGSAEGGRIAGSKFYFGFDAYLGDNGKLPEEADLPKLQRQLDLISSITAIAAESGVLEIREVRRDARTAAELEAAAQAAKPRRGPAKKAAEAPTATSLEYGFQMMVTPAAMVKLMNALTADDRFIIVKEFSFVESADKIVQKLSEREQAAAAAQARESRGGRGRRGRRGEEQPVEQQAADESKKTDRLVIDPEIDAPIQLDLTIVVWDFGAGVEVTLEAPEASAADKVEETAEEAPAAKAEVAETKEENVAAETAAPAKEDAAAAKTEEKPAKAFGEDM